MENSRIIKKNSTGVNKRLQTFVRVLYYLWESAGRGKEKAMADLKEREQKVLDYITEQIRQNGFPPTVRDIGAALGIKSTSTVQKSMEILEKDLLPLAGAGETGR